jgi:radical SAM protein with 4Fe4S-binding SPASM domain
MPLSLTPERATAVTPLPKFVQIEPVGQCNLRCRMCPIQFRPDGGPGKPPAFMPYDVYCRLVDQFSGMTELQLQGMGEPMLHPRFFDMVSYAAARGVAVSTNSNLTVLSERRAEECVRSGLAQLHVSLDAPTAESYEYIRVRSRFGRVLQNLRRLVDARARLCAQRPEIHLVTVAMRRNVHELAGLVRLACELGVFSVSVQHLCHDFTEDTLPERYRSMREFVESETLVHEDPARVERCFGEARETARELNVALRLPNLGPRRHAPSASGRSRCDWPWRGAYVSYAGDAMPCCMVATPDRVNFGNMREDGVEAVWNNAAYNAFRERLDHGPPPGVCAGCAVYAGTF